MARIQKFLIPSVLIIWLFSPFPAFALNKIFNIRHWTAPDHTRVVIDASDDIPYTVKKDAKKLLIDFQDSEVPENFPQELTLARRGIEKIMIIPLPGGAVRIQLSITENVETKVFNIAKFQEKPYRVVVDIEFPDIEKQEGEEREQIKVLRKDKIIVIDPGHGGEDPGAVGKTGTQEKNVVLLIGKKLMDTLNKKKGYRAFLTRDGDYYVPFKKRMKIAREYGADLFVSIHADAFRKRGARGSSVYCLSLRGASSEAARILARNENLADIVGGSPNGENSDDVDPIILNMFQTNTINSSKIFGGTVLKYLNRVNRVKFNRVQEAPFIVLKLPETPSLLVETAYISNPREEKLLRSGRFQTELAGALANSITEFLSYGPVQPPTTPKIVLTKSEDKKPSVDREHKPRTPYVETRQGAKHEDVAQTDGAAKQEDDVKRHATGEKDKTKPGVIHYPVRKGDTLDKIAVKHNTNISTLLKLNRMKLRDPLYAGRTLKIPASQSPPSSVPPPMKTYRVKKGDSLDKIAKRHRVLVTALMKLNKIKMNDPLYVDRKLKIPVTEKDKEEMKKNVVIKPAKTYTYRVRKGDTLDKIARRCKTSIGELQRMNQMKRADPLYVNQKLKLPAHPSL